MKKMRISADLSHESGIIRKIHGINNSVQIQRADTVNQMKELFHALKIPRVRYHDAALENPGYALVDVSRIFPLFHADESDPANYNFGVTDDYLKLAATCNCKIEFRLGETIEHSEIKYRVTPPSDFNKWADICLNIIRHYNEGWADGLHLGIDYWSIWEEPDNRVLFNGVYEEYFKLYDITAKKIKSVFPGLKVGGPQTMGGVFSSRFEEFLQFCQANRTPLDFIAWTAYFGTIDKFVISVKKATELVTYYGYPDAEINIAEWHYVPEAWTWDDVWKDKVITGANSCAFTTGVLTELQDSAVSMTFFYAWAAMQWGLIDSTWWKPFPVYYAFKAFAEMTDCKKRIAISKNCDVDGVNILAGKNSPNELLMLLSCFKSEALKFELNISGATFKTCSIRVVDDESYLLEKAVLKKENNGTFSFRHYGGSVVYLLKFG